MKFFKNPVTDIPDVFLPYGQPQPFSTCINCDRHLLDDHVEYVVEKAIRQYSSFNSKDVIFEYAICMDCALAIRNELSKESMQNIQQYLESTRMLSSRKQLIGDNNWNVQDWLSHCAISGEAIEEQQEYQIYGHCRGRQLIFSGMPYMVGGKAAEEMAGLLSEKTRDELGRFMDDHFGLPPELKKIIQDKPFVML